MALHLTTGSSAYLEGLWVWNADHDLDWPGNAQLSLYSGRGILSESAGPVWLIGTASEHHVLYQYSLVGASNHYIGTAQTETPYFQPNPAPPAPFVQNAEFIDPQLEFNASWALNVEWSNDIILFGTGFYSFFQDYTQTCLTTYTCQQQIVNVDSASTIQVFSLTTVGTTYQLSMYGVGAIPQSQDRNGFGSTATWWEQSWLQWEQ